MKFIILKKMVEGLRAIIQHTNVLNGINLHQQLQCVTEVFHHKTMSILEEKGKMEQFWQDYFQKEKAIYEQLLADPDTAVTGTVKELAEKYGVDVQIMTGFLDGINDSLVEPNPIEEMEEDTPVSLAFDKEKLYKNMVDAKADWLYGLDAWKEIYSEEELKDLYREAKKMNTIVKGKKIGRNDPCPCGSGKKYKFCCGRNA